MRVLGVGVLAAFILLFASTQARAQERIGATDDSSVTTPARFRFGFSAGVGVGSLGFGGAVSGRLGVQITPSLATSYQVASAGTSSLFGDDENSWTSHALLIELMPGGSMFAMGGGPSLAIGTKRKGCFSFLGGSDCIPSSKDYLGLGFDGRIGYTFGVNRRDRRGGFTLELAAHVGSEETLVTTGIGVDIF